MAHINRNTVKNVRINEITLRDGLQNIGSFIPTEKKLKLLDLLVGAGAVYIESTAFVSPRWIPQLSDAKILCQAASTIDKVHNSVLIPNEKGFYRALECGVDDVVGVLSVSEIHNKNNVNKSVDQSLEEMKKTGEMAVKKGVVPRLNIATAFGYQKDEIISPERVLFIAKSLEESGFKGITLCDTTGIAAPDQVYELCRLLTDGLESAEVAVHFHQKDGIEFANTYAAVCAGITVFESAAGGLGGCPYAREAEGNIDTEKLVKMFHRMGLKCGICPEKIRKASQFAKELQLEYSIKQAAVCN